MKLLYLLTDLILIAALYYVNYEYLKIGLFTFTGIALVVLLVLNLFRSVVLNIAAKRKGTKSSTSFIFSEGLAEKMKNMDQGIQYESTVLSLAFIIIGSIGMVIYIIFFMQMSLVLKVFIAFNSICGVVLMTSMLITNYQQLVSYRLAVESYATASNPISNSESNLDIMKGGSL